MSKIKEFFEDFTDNVKHLWKTTSSWIYYHFRVDFWRILKTALSGYPWDETYLYELEYAKIQEMMNHHKRTKRFEGWEKVVRDMQICLNLIDIINEKKDLYDYSGDCEFVPVKGNPDLHELKGNMTYKCLVKVNLKNYKRFFIYRGYSESEGDVIKRHPHELYIRKAKYLYHKIRMERDLEWWD